MNQSLTLNLARWSTAQRTYYNLKSSKPLPVFSPTVGEGETVQVSVFSEQISPRHQWVRVSLLMKVEVGALAP